MTKDLIDTMNSEQRQICKKYGDNSKELEKFKKETYNPFCDIIKKQSEV